MQSECPDVHRLMAEPDQEIDRGRSEPRVGEEAHLLRAKRAELVLGESGGVGEGLAEVLFLEVGQVGDDLRRRHAVTTRFTTWATEIRSPRIVARQPEHSDSA